MMVVAVETDAVLSAARPQMLFDLRVNTNGCPERAKL